MMKLLVLALAVAVMFSAGESSADPPAEQTQTSAALPGVFRPPPRRRLHGRSQTVSAGGEGLSCHRCVSKVPGGPCELSVETCKPDRNGCVTAKFLREPCEFKQKKKSEEFGERFSLGPRGEGTTFG